jgi:copper chaperone
MIELTVKDMSCSHCAATITRAVKEVDAGGRCEVDLEARRVRIDSAMPVAAFVAALAKAGYSSRVEGQPG